MKKKTMAKWAAIPLATSIAFAGFTPVIGPVSTVHAAQSVEQTQINKYATEMVKFFNDYDVLIEKGENAKTVAESKKIVTDTLAFVKKNYVKSDAITKKYSKEIGSIHQTLDVAIEHDLAYFQAISDYYNDKITEKEADAIAEEKLALSEKKAEEYYELLDAYIKKHKVTPSADLDYLVYGIEAEVTTYVVKKGDTLYSIAKAHKTTVADLKKLNNLKNDKISIGQKLKLKAEEKVVTPPKETTPVETKTAKVTASSLNVRSGPSTKDKVVGGLKKGDTVKVLSVDGKWAKITHGKVTGYVSTDHIKIETPAKTPEKEPAKTPVASKTHTVQKGDTLYNISKKYGVPVNTLKSLNNLKNDNIKIGQKLVIKK